jgi:hypothetical protein
MDRNQDVSRGSHSREGFRLTTAASQHVELSSTRAKQRCLASGASVPAINDDENSHSFVVFDVSTIPQSQPSSCLFSLLTEPASLFQSLAFPLPYPYRCLRFQFWFSTQCCPSTQPETISSIASNCPTAFSHRKSHPSLSSHSSKRGRLLPPPRDQLTPPAQTPLVMVRRRFKRLEQPSFQLHRLPLVRSTPKRPGQEPSF